MKYTVPHFFVIMVSQDNGDIRYTGRFSTREEAENALNDVKLSENEYRAMVIELGGF